MYKPLPIERSTHVHHNAQDVRLRRMWHVWSVQLDSTPSKPNSKLMPSRHMPIRQGAHWLLKKGISSTQTPRMSTRDIGAVAL